MKIDAKVELSDAKVAEYGQILVKIPIDIDYVEDNSESINEWVVNELEEMFGGTFSPLTDFTILNIDEIIETIAFDEFEKKTEI